MTVDFLCIGAHKSATTWLHYNLKNHPDIWVPFRKELHYFDRSPIYPSPSILSSQYLLCRLFGKANHNKRFRQQFSRDLYKAIITKNLKDSIWILKYYLGSINDEWYRSLFKPGEGKLKGEVTPSYSILDLKDVMHIKDLFPKLKVILFLRCPIDRAWSHVRYAWMNGNLPNIEAYDQVKSFIDSPDQSLRSDYIRTINIWRSCFPDEQIHIEFYDDVVQNPNNVLNTVFGFLGARHLDETVSTLVNRRINASVSMKIPAEIDHYLVKKYYPEIDKLSELVGGYSKVWLMETKEKYKVHGC